MSAVRAVLCALALLLAVPAAAAEGEPSPWTFEIMPYAWIPGNYGSLTVKGRTADIDVTPGDVIDMLFDGDVLAGGGYFGVGYERWSFFTDVFGGFMKQDVNEKIPTPYCQICIAAKDKMTFVMADFAFGYRLGQWSLPKRQRPISLGVYAGARYMHFDNELTVRGGVVGGIQRSGNVSQTFDWADPIIGIRWEVPVHDRVSLAFRGDIGGFGASSDLVWGLVADVRYWMAWNPMGARTYLTAGYRALAFDRTNRVGDIDIQFRGPTAGVGFVF